MNNQDKINLIQAIYQSGNNLSNFISDLNKLNSILDGETVDLNVQHNLSNQNNSPIQPTGLELIASKYKVDHVTAEIIKNWSTVLQRTDIEYESEYELLPFQEEFLFENRSDSSNLTQHHAYLTSKSCGMTTIMAIYIAAEMLKKPFYKIIYVSESNATGETMSEALTEIIVPNSIENSSGSALTLVNGSTVKFLSHSSFTNSLRASGSNDKACVANYIHKWGRPDVVIIDSAHRLPFSATSVVSTLMDEVHRSIVAGRPSDPKGYLYSVMSNRKTRWIKKKMIPWYDGASSADELVQACFTQDQHDMLQLCQFSKSQNLELALLNDIKKVKTSHETMIKKIREVLVKTDQNGKVDAKSVIDLVEAVNASNAGIDWSTLNVSSGLSLAAVSETVEEIIKPSNEIKKRNTDFYKIDADELKKIKDIDPSVKAIIPDIDDDDKKTEE